MFDRPLIFVWPDAIAFWGILIWAYAMEARQLQQKKQRSAGHEGADRYSGLVISIGTSLLQLGAVALAFYAPSAMSADVRYPAYAGGLGLIVAGMLLRMHCWRELGAFFTHTVTIADDHRVVDGGAYRLLRHPSYLGALLTLMGLGLVLGNYASLMLMCIGSWSIYIYRIQVEEAALESALGEPYTRFKQTRKRLIPYVY